MKLVKKFSFDSAHYLPNYAGKCKQLHGHTYYLEIIVTGEPNPDTGMIIDFYDIDYIVKGKILSKLDHHCLNDVLPNPTVENLAIFILNDICQNMPDFPIGIRLYETPSGYVEIGEC